MASSRDLEIVVRAGADSLASDLSRMTGMLRSFAKSVPAVDVPKLSIDTASIKASASHVRDFASSITSAHTKTASFFTHVAIGAATSTAAFAALQVGIGHGISV